MLQNDCWFDLSKRTFKPLTEAQQIKFCELVYKDSHICVNERDRDTSFGMSAIEYCNDFIDFLEPSNEMYEPLHNWCMTNLDGTGRLTFPNFYSVEGLGLRTSLLILFSTTLLYRKYCNHVSK